MIRNISSGRQIVQNTFLIGRNVFLVDRKRLLCVRAKSDICERLGTSFFYNIIVHIYPPNNEEHPWH